MCVFIRTPYSKLCKHTFSRRAIYSLIARNRGQIECPIPGCTARLTQPIFYDDRLMERKVARALAESGEGTQTDVGVWPAISLLTSCYFSSMMLNSEPYTMIILIRKRGKSTGWVEILVLRSRILFLELGGARHETYNNKTVLNCTLYPPEAYPSLLPF